MVHIVTQKRTVGLSTPEKGMRAPKWKFWAENGYIHIVDEDTGAYTVVNRVDAEARLDGLMAIFKFAPTANRAIDELDVAHREEIKALFEFEKEFRALLKLAEEQEAKLHSRIEAAVSRRSARIFVPGS